MKLNRKHLILVVLLPIQVGLLQVAKKHPAFIEYYYSTGIYPYISKLLRFLLGWIPFSLGDILIAILVFLGFRSLYKFIKTRFQNFIPKFIHFTAFLSVAYFCFYFFWGLNYYRESLAKNLGFSTSKYTTEQLFVLSKEIIKKTNKIQISITKSDTLQVVNPYSEHEIYVKAINGYHNVAKKYPQLAYQNKAVKSSLMSLLQTYNGTSGYFNPFTGEAQVNDRIPKTGFPNTTCHEMAHQIGWAAENEANFVGFLASVSNDDLYFKYAGYRMATRYLIFELHKRDPDLFKQAYATIHKGILKDFNGSSAFWKAYENPFEPIVKKGYNAYLKANKQDKGIASYNYVIDLLIHYFEKETI